MRPNTWSWLNQEIGAIEDAKTCQKFCKELYPGTCVWFMYDRTTHDCKLFSGSLDDLQNDCQEIGYSVQPIFTECNTTFAVESEHACFVSRNQNTIRLKYTSNFYVLPVWATNHSSFFIYRTFEKIIVGLTSAWWTIWKTYRTCPNAKQLANTLPIALFSCMIRLKAFARWIRTSKTEYVISSMVRPIQP